LNNHGENYSPPKARFWRYLVVLIILGLGMYLLLPQITKIEYSISVVERLVFWAVGLAIFVQVLSYLSSGYTLHAILSLNKQKLSLFMGALITMASASIGLVSGGILLGGAAATIGWLHRSGRDPNSAALAGTLPPILYTSVLLGIALFGTGYLIFVHDLTNTQLIEVIVILIILGLISTLVILAIRFPEFTKRIVGKLACWVSRAIRRPFDLTSINKSIDNFVLAVKSLRRGNWIKPALGAAATVGFDMMTLYFFFVAAGQRIPPGVLLSGYGLPLFLGRMAFFVPGGVGVVEGTMVAFYDSLNISNPVSVVVVLGYRLVSFWTPTILGFIAAAYLSGRSSKRIK
jgi:uncharacterized protein (TIRG00374 family)